jgi:hypothetical protein
LVEKENLMLRSAFPVFLALALASVSNLAAAEAGEAGKGARAKPDYSRTGCYLGLAGTVAFPLSEDDVDESLGLHARGGCRGKWGGGEVHYEWLEGFSADLDGTEIEIDGWALTVDGKVYPLAGLEDRFHVEARRIQPFATVGFGYLKLGGDWDFAARLGGGLDVYVTRNIAINIDATWVVPTTDRLDDTDYLSVGWGVLYRF